MSEWVGPRDIDKECTLYNSIILWKVGRISTKIKIFLRTTISETIENKIWLMVRIYFVKLNIACRCTLTCFSMKTYKSYLYLLCWNIVQSTLSDVVWFEKLPGMNNFENWEPTRLVPNRRFSWNVVFVQNFVNYEGSFL